jgi:diadenosine tetraphosphate (Ap4A) HIT family hydrolase
VEILDLDLRDQERLWTEIRLAVSVLRDLFQPTKLNVAALGNQVPQLHIHVIARFAHDAAWPGPVWGAHAPIPYEPDAEAKAVLELQGAFALPRC